MRKIKQRSGTAFLRKIQARRAKLAEYEQERRDNRAKRLRSERKHARLIRGKTRMKVWAPGHRLHSRSVYVINDSNAPALIVVTDWHANDQIIISSDAVISVDEFVQKESERQQKMREEREKTGNMSRSFGSSRIPLMLAAIAVGYGYYPPSRR